MMRGMVALAVVGLAVLATTMALPAVASAGPVQDAVAGLRDSPVFVDPAAGRELDIDGLRERIGDQPIRIAILPAGPGTSEVRGWPREISRELPGNTIAVVSGRYFYAGSDVLCHGVAGRAATRAIARHNTTLDQDENSDLTEALTDFVAELSTAPRCTSGDGAGRGDRYADEPGGGVAFADDDTMTVLPYVAGGLAAGVLGAGGWVLVARRRAAAAAARLREQSRALVSRLGAELEALPDPATGPEGGPEGGPTSGPESSPGSGTAADVVDPATAAAASYAEAQALLLGASTEVQYAAAGNAAIAGLAAARAARGGQGPPIPDPDPRAEPSGPPAP